MATVAHIWHKAFFFFFTVEHISRMFPHVCVHWTARCVCAFACVRVMGVIGALITTLILFSQRPLKLPPLHQVSVWLPGNRGSGVPERHGLFPTNDPPERGKMGGGEDVRRKDTNWLMEDAASRGPESMPEQTSSVCLSAPPSFFCLALFDPIYFKLYLI